MTFHSDNCASVFCLFFVFLIMWFNMLIDLTASFIHRESTLSSIKFIFKAPLWSWKSPMPFLPDVWVCSVCCLGVLWKLQALKKSPLGHDCDVPGSSILPQPLSPMKSLLQCKETVKHWQRQWPSMGTDDVLVPQERQKRKKNKNMGGIVYCTHTMHPYHLACSVESSLGRSSSD